MVVQLWMLEKTVFVLKGASYKTILRHQHMKHYRSLEINLKKTQEQAYRNKKYTTIQELPLDKSKTCAKYVFARIFGFKTKTGLRYICTMLSKSKVSTLHSHLTHATKFCTQMSVLTISCSMKGLGLHQTALTSHNSCHKFSQIFYTQHASNYIKYWAPRNDVGWKKEKCTFFLMAKWSSLPSKICIPAVVWIGVCLVPFGYLTFTGALMALAESCDGTRRARTTCFIFNAFFFEWCKRSKMIYCRFASFACPLSFVGCMGVTWALQVDDITQM